MQRLSICEWVNIFRNLEEAGEEVEIMWLESTDEWVLCCDCELFEDGFPTEEEAQKRLLELEEAILCEEEEEEESKYYNSNERAMKEAGHRQSDFL